MKLYKVIQDAKRRWGILDRQTGHFAPFGTSWKLAYIHAIKLNTGRRLHSMLFWEDPSEWKPRP